MKKFLVIVAVILLCLAALPLVSWWLMTDSTPDVAPTAEWHNGDIKRAKQLLRDNSQSGGQKISLAQRDLLLLMQYGIEQTALPLTADLHLGAEENLLLLTLDTGSPLRSFINIRLAFSFEGKDLRWHSGQFGELSLAPESLSTLQALLWPNIKAKLPITEVEPLWQSVERVATTNQRATVYFHQHADSNSLLQQQQLQFLLGKNALERLPYYQHYLEAQFAEQGRHRLSLSIAVQRLFEEAKRQQQADIVSEHKAIILSLFLHAANHRSFAGIDLPEVMTLPVQPLRFSLERRQDLAQHLLTTATITLFANSAIADSVGLYKELEDQQSATGFDIRDLIADQAGSLLATRLTADIEEARRLQARLARLKDENELFPATRQLAAQLQLQLINNESGDTAVIESINEKIGQHLRQSPIYNSP